MNDEFVEEMAYEGRSKIIQYCDMGMENIERVRHLTTLDDHSKFTDPEAVEVVTDACVAATTLATNFGQLAKVLTVLLMMARPRKNEEN